MHIFRKEADGAAVRGRHARGGVDAIEIEERVLFLDHAGEPAEVAPCYLFLASQDASYITGQVMGINGGFYM